MAQQNTKQIGTKSNEKPVSKMDALRDTWSVIKPFAHFSVKALHVLAQSLVFIVKNIPKPDTHKEKNKDNKVIKI